MKTNLRTDNEADGSSSQDKIDRVDSSTNVLYEMCVAQFRCKTNSSLLITDCLNLKDNNFTTTTCSV